jgi:hypothetical protein
VNPYIDPGVPNHSGHEEEGEGPRPIGGGEEGGLGCDVRGMARGKRKGTPTTADEDAYSLQSLAGARALDPKLEELAHRIGGEKEQQGHHHHKPPLPASPDNKSDPHEGEREDERIRIGDGRHEEIENAITEVSVDHPKKEEVEARHDIMPPASPGESPALREDSKAFRG